jgi:dipeptidyl aminopeptidase/acylaminoacyl peptidase
MIKTFTCFYLVVCPVMSLAALNYQMPVDEIRTLVEAPLAPQVRIDSRGEQLLLLYRDPYKTIAELSEPELRLGGLRVNPVINIGSRTRYYNDLAVKRLHSEFDNDMPASPVVGLPASPRLAYFSWSPDERFISFTHTSDTGVEIWLLEVKSHRARRLSLGSVNANLGNPVTWSADSQSLLVTMLPANQSKLIETDTAVPTGPTVSDSDGAKAQNRTYQDLLKSPADEQNFERLVRSEIYRIDLKGSSKRWLAADLYQDIEISPDGHYVLVTRIKRPFSYLVPFYRFASQTDILTQSGEVVKLLLDKPLDEVRAKGFMATTKQKRDFLWRADHAATITWVKALDGGDPAVDVDFRDEAFELSAPFTDKHRSLVKTRNRLAVIHWGNDQLAVVEDFWFDNRNTKTYAFNPADASTPARLIFDRNYQDRYSDPGRFVESRNSLNQHVLALEDGKAFLFGEGFSEKGQFPFVDQIDFILGKRRRLYESAYTNRLERLVEGISMQQGRILVRLESPSEYPNYYLRNILSDTLLPITSFANPYSALSDVHKEVITYQRDDGLSLSATLYLPAGYDPASGKKLPLLVWAYPVEYKDKNSAGQNTSNASEFNYPHYGSPIFWVTRGFAVLDDAAFPIVGEADSEPNDSFRMQLVGNAKAAIDAVDQLGYIDRNRVAVGGHSYGAFMVANLLSHSDLFAAGIARSGAYNRTLTPFGFQREERSYWDAPEVYYGMSPFMHADKMKTPLLLIHGAADNNSGTYPMQSERYFNALKGLGAPSRLVILPKESHGYRGKESILHMLWEQDQWLQRYVKASP